MEFNKNTPCDQLNLKNFTVTSHFTEQCEFPSWGTETQIKRFLLNCSLWVQESNIFQVIKHTTIRVTLLSKIIFNVLWPKWINTFFSRKLQRCQSPEFKGLVTSPERLPPRRLLLVSRVNAKVNSNRVIKNKPWCYPELDQEVFLPKPKRQKTYDEGRVRPSPECCQGRSPLLSSKIV